MSRRRPAADGPQRTCVGCHRRHPSAVLTRVTLGSDGRPAVGRTLPGRGAWVCTGSPPCLERAVAGAGLGRALRTTLSPKASSELAAAVERQWAAGSTGDPPE